MMSRDPKIQSCATCAFFTENNLCLRNPPTMLPAYGSDGSQIGFGRIWPEMQPDEICGQWAADPETHKKIVRQQALVTAGVNFSLGSNEKQ